MRPLSRKRRARRHQSRCSRGSRLSGRRLLPCSILKVSTGTTAIGARWQIDREQGISKAGNRRLRTTLIELAWLWVRHQPDSALSRWFRARVGNERGRVRRIAIVALARKLLIALWRYVTLGEVPEGAVLKAA